MAEIYLITQNDFIPYQEISFNVDPEKTLKPFILQAQIGDLLPMLGSAFYQDFITNINQQNYQDLLNGKQYTPPNTGNYPVQYLGLKGFLCYSTFARYVVRANITSTATGLVRKKRDDSENLESKELNSLADQARSMARVYEDGIAFYLYYNRADYPIINTVFSSIEFCGDGSIWSHKLFYNPLNRRQNRGRITEVG